MKPTKGPLAELSDTEFQEFLDQLGILIFRSPIASTVAHHTHPFSTLRDYVSPSADHPKPVALAMLFLKDLCTPRKFKTEDLCEKWLGGVEAVHAMISSMPGRI